MASNLLEFNSAVEQSGEHLILKLGPEDDTFYYNITVESPQENNSPHKMNFFSNNSAAASMVDGQESHYFVGTMDPESDLDQYGYYGVYSTVPADEDVGVSQVPQQWGTSNFYSSQNLTSSYNSYSNVDTDEEGNIYVAANNVLATEDLGNRAPMISKSTDGGETWSDFSMMRAPSDLETSYASNFGGNRLSTLDPYKQDGFVVWGVDQASYFSAQGVFNDVNDDSTDFLGLHMVEHRYDNGTWSVHFVAEIYNPDDDVDDLYLYRTDEVSDNDLHPFQLRLPPSTTVNLWRRNSNYALW